MSKLHEILAVEGSLEAAANKLIEESKKTFSKDSLFTGQTRRLEMFRDEDKHAEADEHQHLESTVDENIDYLAVHVAKWFDVVLQKDSANREAVADVIVDGVTIAEQLPATFLLGLESKLNRLRQVYDAIPTLAPGIEWVEDAQSRKGVYKSKHDVISMKTAKEPEFITVAQATIEHAAQVERVENTKDVGKYTTTRQSGMMTPLEKANRLSRLDTLARAVKQARMRANEVKVEPGNIGKVLLDFINKPN